MKTDHKVLLGQIQNSPRREVSQIPDDRMREKALKSQLQRLDTCKHFIVNHTNINTLYTQLNNIIHD